MSRFAVIGASGFVGSALCERMYFQGMDFTPFVHSTGNAARITRLSVPIQKFDLLKKESLPDLLKGYDVVVNCALGDGAAMTTGFQNLLDTLAQLKIRKFIHLSSTAIYGEEPGPQSAKEDGKPDPQGNPYAVLKLKQDEAAFQLNKKGVATYVLCPVNIVGPYSLFTIGLIEALKSGEMPLVNGGSNPCNFIHVDNLVDAILAAAEAPGGSGERYFVNETRFVSWRETLEDHARLMGVQPRFFDVTREQVLPFLLGQQKKAGLKGHAKILISGQFRRAVSALPVMASVNNLAGAAFGSLPDKTKLNIRQKLQWPLTIPRAKTALDANSKIARVQIRSHYHSPEKLQNLGWTPSLNYENGMQNTASWLKFAGLLEP